ncbi:hypothetical protein E2562_026752 [Oryza meyeriana var. granulata]|uniref:Leucine-rich repeat-containing N-terminal plant-type domain-containing protein n=1 Tax=Oryza meyeriana var. granulata TaxID=110450 RepID=A0A6G1C9F1_9ORYZ|nr:hypothetical protein E2562_026752 [Oryza meyeriana var. granulata]
MSQLNILSLGGNDIVGSIPAVLSNLTMLTVLDLAFCKLNGTIPTELGKMTQLTFLHLSPQTVQNYPLAVLHRVAH